MTQKHKSAVRDNLLQNRWFRSGVLLLIGIAATIGLSIAFLRLSDSSTTVTFINDGQCPEVTFTLGDSNTAIETVVLKPGEKEVVKVIPDAVYVYTIRTGSDPDASNRTCYEQDTGTISLPQGSNLTVYARSQTSPTVRLINDTTCPRVIIELDNGRETLRADLAKGLEELVELTVNSEYAYTVTGMGDDPACIDGEGTIELDLDEAATIRVSAVEPIE
ncbi:MAG: hypothetical protein H6673_01790 [Anaerolineales bacterium]|nr:hypothetical protein [Anaerolineales bacterium]